MSKAKQHSLMTAVMNGAVIVLGDQVGALKYALVEINSRGAINYGIHQFVSDKEFKEAGFKNDERFEESTLHIDGEWAGADDGLLRRVLYAKTNQPAVDNAYRTRQVIDNLNVDIESIRSTLSIPASTGLATEHVIEPRLPHEFEELSLLQIFKFINNEDQTTLAIKVGRSTAITGIVLDDSNNLMNVAKYNFNGEKIRMRKHAMVVIIN